MELNLSSRISNQTTIYYAKRNGYKIVRPRDYPNSSPTKKKSSKASSTKQWVQKSFYTTTKLPSTATTIPPKSSGPKSNDSKKPQEKQNPRPKNEPAAFFEKSGVMQGAEKFKFCLVGKFPGPKPSLEKIREWAGREWKLEGDLSITLLDRSHVFLRLENEADMLKIWPRNRWFVEEHLMKVFKWLPTFKATSSSTVEPSLAAVWISFPQLPLVFFLESFLFRIASLVGRVFCMDEPTKNLSRTIMARICVEVDLTKKFPKRLWIGIGTEGFWQEVFYESLPSYCTNCLQQGHPTPKCKLERKVAGMADAPDQQKVGKKLSFNYYQNSVSGFKVEMHGSNSKNLYNTCPVVLGRDDKGIWHSRRQLLLNRSASLYSGNIDRAKGTRGRDEWKITNKKPGKNVISGSEQNNSAIGLIEKPSEDSEKVGQNLSSNEPNEVLISIKIVSARDSGTPRGNQVNEKDVLDDAVIEEKVEKNPTFGNQPDTHQQQSGVEGSPTLVRSPELESTTGK